MYRVQLCCRRSCAPRAVSCRSGFEATFLKRLCKIFLWMSKMGQSINACSSSSVVGQDCQDSAFFSSKTNPQQTCKSTDSMVFIHPSIAKNYGPFLRNDIHFCSETSDTSVMFIDVHPDLNPIGSYRRKLLYKPSLALPFGAGIHSMAG